MKSILFSLVFMNGLLLWADWSLNMEVLSGDTWRGLQFNDSATFQPEISFTRNRLTLTAWGSMDLTDSFENEFQFTRTEFTLQVHHEVAKFLLTGGVSHFRFPGFEVEPTTELFVGVFYSHKLEPGLQVYYDVDQIQGWYVQTGIFPTLPLFQNNRSDGLELGIMIGLGSDQFTRHYFHQGDMGGMEGDPMGHGNGPGQMGGMEQDSSGAFQYMLSLEYPIRAGSGQVAISATYLHSLNDEVRSPRFENDNSFLTFGLAYRISF